MEVIWRVYDMMEHDMIWCLWDVWGYDTVIGQCGGGCESIVLTEQCGEGWGHVRQLVCVGVGARGGGGCQNRPTIYIFLGQARARAEGGGSSRHRATRP